MDADYSQRGQGPQKGQNDHDTREPDAVKAARPVRGGGYGKGLAEKLPGVYPGKSKASTVPRQAPTQLKVGSAVAPASPAHMEKLEAEPVTRRKLSLRPTRCIIPSTVAYM
jgi:hypothetical protein